MLAANSLLALDDLPRPMEPLRSCPSSHKWESGRRPMRDQAIPLSCPASSVMCSKSVLDLI